MKVYRIRDKNGLYSTGGTSPDFTKGGKTWSNIGHVKSHLRQFLNTDDLEVYADAEIVCVEYTEKDVESYDIFEYLGELSAKDIADYEKYTYKSEYGMKRLEAVKNKIDFLKQKRDKNETKEHNS